MKVLINISEQDYELACNYPTVLFGSYARSIKKGTPIPDNATNGDIIKAMLPVYHVQINTALESVNLYYEGTEEYAGSCIRFDLSWWNAPYEEKRGSKE